MLCCRYLDEWRFRLPLRRGNVLPVSLHYTMPQSSSPNLDGCRVSRIAQRLPATFRRDLGETRQPLVAVHRPAGPVHREGWGDFIARCGGFRRGNGMSYRSWALLQRYPEVSIAPSRGFIGRVRKGISAAGKLQGPPGGRIKAGVRRSGLTGFPERGPSSFRGRRSSSSRGSCGDRRSRSRRRVPGCARRRSDRIRGYRPSTS